MAREFVVGAITSWMLREKFGTDHLVGARLSSRHGRRHALPDVPSNRRFARRQTCDDGGFEERAEIVRYELSWPRRSYSLPTFVLPLHRAVTRI